MADHPAARPDYPYPDRPMLPQWHDRIAQLQAVFALAMAVAATLFAPHSTSLHAVALLIILPAALSFILAFAPDPKSPVSALTKDIFVLGAALAVWVGPWLGLVVACAPLGLIAGIVLGSLRLKLQARQW